MAKVVFKLPDVGEGVVEAEIAKWYVAAGDRVEEDQHLVDVMTDKATVEITSPVTGVIQSITGKPGELIPVGTDLIVFETDAPAAEKVEEKALEPVAAKVPEKVAEKAEAPAPKQHKAEKPTPPLKPTAFPGTKPLASPAVRLRALEKNIDLADVPGSGPAGRITHADLDAFIASGGRPATTTRRKRTGVTEIPIIGLRRKIAERMQTAKRHIPHITYVDEMDISALEELRQHLNAKHGSTRPKLTLLPFIMAALVKALDGVPHANAHYDDEKNVLLQHAPVHIGIATQTPDGLKVPVVRHAESLDLWQAAAEVARLAEAARNNTATLEELTGSTITITSLGKLGGIVTTPIVNYPEVAIIGVNNAVDRPVVRNGQIVIRKMMNLSSSFDHRIVDGADAAELVQVMKALLEQPAMLFIE
jgi:2-oxoisovalerate dehydrogenase E2 component (dihydrolipoyl transacylase)